MVDAVSRLDEINQILKAQGADILSKDSCTPTLLVSGIFAPFAIWLGLYFAAPSIVLVPEGSKDVVCGKQVLKWTAILTLVVWVALYAYSYFSGYGADSNLCLV
jgi:hypothetical protein